MSSEQIANQIAQLERQLAVKRQELDFVRQIEDLDRQREEIDRRQRQAQLELQRFQATASLEEVAAQLPEPTPEPESTSEPVTENEETSLSSDAILLVQNIVFRLTNLNIAGKTFDRDADEMINRVRTEGTAAIRYLTELLGLAYNQGQYRRMIKNALRLRKEGAK